jgi:PEP-CTERM motif
VAADYFAGGAVMLVTYLRPVYDRCGNVIGWVRAQGPRAFVDGLRHVTRRAAHGCSGVPPWLLRGAVGGGLMGGVPTAHVEPLGYAAPPPAAQPAPPASRPTGSTLWFVPPDAGLLGYAGGHSRYQHVDGYVPTAGAVPVQVADVVPPVTLTPTRVPEPASLAVLGVGVVALRVVRRRR